MAAAFSSYLFYLLTQKTLELSILPVSCIWIWFFLLWPEYCYSARFLCPVSSLYCFHMLYLLFQKTLQLSILPVSCICIWFFLLRSEYCYSARFLRPVSSLYRFQFLPLLSFLLSGFICIPTWLFFLWSLVSSWQLNSYYQSFSNQNLLV